MTDIKLNDKEFSLIRKQIGDNIQKARKDKSITQEQLAALTGLDRVSIGYLEQGVRSGLRSIILVARALKIPPTQLFENF